MTPLLDYWKEWPPAHVILAHVHRAKPEKQEPPAAWPGSLIPPAPAPKQQADELPPPGFIESLPGVVKVTRKTNG